MKTYFVLRAVAGYSLMVMVERLQLVCRLVFSPYLQRAFDARHPSERCMVVDEITLLWKVAKGKQWTAFNAALRSAEYVDA